MSEQKQSEGRTTFINEFIKRVQSANGHLPLLTLDEFFNGNMEEDSIAPNQWGYGRPSLAEIRACLRKVEERPDVAWVRVALHDDTNIEETGEEIICEIAGESIVICTSADAKEIEKAVNVEWMCSDGLIHWTAPDNLFTDIPSVPKEHRVLELVWD